MNGYYVYPRIWFDFAFENPDKATGNHASVYLWNVELNNRLGWVKKFSSPSSQAMAATGIKSYNTYKKVFDDLVSWGFIEVIQESKNQYSSCVIALSNFDKAPDKALDKALTNHVTSHSESTVQRSEDIIRPIEINKDKPIDGDAALKKSDFDLREDDRGVMTCQVLRQSCIDYFKANKADYPEAMYAEFILWWSQPNSKGVPKWFVEKTKKGGTWHLPGRLATWFKNYKPAGGKQIPLKPDIPVSDRLKIHTY